MPAHDSGQPLSPETASRLAEFARACKAAARGVALYPATHPTIRAALDRVAGSAHRLRGDAAVTLTILPDGIRLDGEAAARPDGALAELAALLHSHLIGELRLTGDPTAEQWHAFLTLLARAPAELRAAGGIGSAWEAAGTDAILIRQIDYAEVLRDRGDGGDAGWDRIIASFLDGEVTDVDEDAMTALLGIADDAAQFARFTEQLVTRATDGALRGSTGAVLRVLQALADFTARTHPEQLDRILNHVAGVVPRLTPDLVVTLITTGVPSGPSGAPGIDLAGEVRDRLSDRTVGEFVARSVSRDGGATARLAEAFQALVPDAKRPDLLEQARREAEALPVGQQPGFPDLWKSAAELLTWYSDSKFVSEDYGRELATARAHAVEVERVSDDPPERVQAWLATVRDDEVLRLDYQVLLDLLAIETRPEQWHLVADSAVGVIEALVLGGHVIQARALLERLVTAAAQSSPLAEPARGALNRLRAGAVMAHAVRLIRRSGEDVGPITAFCLSLGPSAIRPLVDALTGEHGPVVRRLREVLLAFGPAARASVEELRGSPNPAVRRTAVELLRAFGGADALPDLARLLDNPEPAVQREAVRAIVDVGSADAYAMLGAAIDAAAAGRRDALLQALSAHADEQHAPLFIHLLEHGGEASADETVLTAVVEALGRCGGADAVAALRGVLYGGDWSSPFRTARRRAAAALALRATGSPLAQEALEEAARAGPRGVRGAAQAALQAPPPRMPPRRTS